MGFVYTNSTSLMDLTHHNEAVKTDRYGPYDQPFMKTRRFNQTDSCLSQSDDANFLLRTSVNNSSQ